jgi:hypothetical protein
MKTTVPDAMRNQFARLFGATSQEARSDARAETEWRRILKKLLDELYVYASENVQTDEMHWLMICTAFAAANESLKQEYFWPGFVEGLVRLSVLLLGDYPDHRKRKGGRKREAHYQLNLHRTLHYSQTGIQRVRVLYAAKRLGFPELSTSPTDAMSRFRDAHGYSASHRKFIEWYRVNYPHDYALLF